MLRKTLSELRRVSRTKRTVSLVSILLLLLGLMTVAVVLADDPDLDGYITGGDQYGSARATDPNDDGTGGTPDIPDEYDISDVFVRASDNNATFHAAFDVYSDTIQPNFPGATIAILFDTDGKRSTGFPSTFCPNMGNEYEAHNFATRTLCWVYECTISGCPTQVADCASNSANEWEAAVAHYAVGLTETKCISVGIHFENWSSFQDDSVCDITYCFTDGVTAVDLSSFAAGSGHSASPVVQPAMFALLGLFFLAAAGLVLWRRNGLAR